MKAHTGTYISVQPETQAQAQALVDLLEHRHTTWHIDEDGTFTIFPVAMYPGVEQELVDEIQAL